MAVNRIENEGQHDRIPLCDLGWDESTGLFPDGFVEPAEWFRRPRPFVEGLGERKLHRGRDPSPGFVMKVAAN